MASTAAAAAADAASTTPSPAAVTVVVRSLRTDWTDPTQQEMSDVCDRLLSAKTPQEEYDAALASAQTLKLMHEPWNYYIKCGARKTSKMGVFTEIASKAKRALHPRDVSSAFLVRFVQIGDDKQRDLALRRFERKLLRVG